jgi:hypothetical protein
MEKDSYDNVTFLMIKFISPLFTVPYFKPRDSYVYNFCRFKKKRKTTFHHLFLIALCLELVLTKPSKKWLPTLYTTTQTSQTTQKYSCVMKIGE